VCSWHATTDVITEGESCETLYIMKISVVIPCYNVEQYIRRGLDSILAQTLQEWEAILVDDGATDSTGEICDEYAKKDSRFHVIHQENQGVSCARNNGMKEATGELLYFFDPDDWIEPNCFERCLETYQQYDGDIVHFGFWWVYGNDSFTDSPLSFKVFRKEEIFEHYTKQFAGFSQDALNKYYKGAFIWNHKKAGNAWNCMFKNDFIKQHNLAFPVGMKLGQDEVFMVEASYHASTIVRIPDVFYHYVQRSDGSVNRKKNASFLYNHKFRQLLERGRLQGLIKEFDLHDSYIGSNILSCLKLALKTSDEWRNYKLYRQYVTHPDVQESIKKVSLKGAPLKFSLPVRLLKLRCHKLLFAGCWLLHKMGVADRVSM
jgi:glycosyltransferase involved in cell wall biosynthesis